MSDARWYFTEEQLANSPSRKCGVNAEQELSYRQRAANLIQEMGQRLQVSQLCINTAIVYMHRFYAFHSFTLFHRNSIAAAAFFLAAKVEEQPRKLEHVIKILNICLEKNDNTRESYAEQAQELVFNENVLLQTLGFDVAIDHPHTHVVRACQLFNIVTVSRELRQTCYFMASNSLHLTTMCLKYRPTVVAAFCIYIACKWSRWEIPESREGKSWYSYVDENVTPETLKQLTDEYLQILERSPSKFKSKMKAITSNGQTALNTNPSVHGRDDLPTPPSHHKSQHEKHHHHHHSRSTSSSNNVRKQPSDASASTSKQPTVPAQPSASYKNQSQAPQASVASTHVPRQRPSSSSGAQQPPYPGNSNETATTQKPVNEERTQHRQMLQDAAAYTAAMLPRQTEAGHKPPRMSSTQQPVTMPQPQPIPHVKTQNHEPRHSQSMATKTPAEHHSKNVKHQQSAEFQNHSSSSSSHSQQQQPPPPQMSQKKPNWPQQQSSNSLPKPAQSHVQSSQSQPNLNNASLGNNRSSSSQSLPSYSESTKQVSAAPPITTQNDYWFNEKLQETTTKPASPPRLSKSMFSPSPEHDAFDRNKMMMLTANVKREHTNSPKSEKRSSTPSKRERRSDLSTTPTSQKSSQKLVIPKLENTSSALPLIPDPGSQKKRPFSSIDDGEYGRDNKSRKVEIKTEPPIKHPDNPEIVKSLLQECYSSSSKFDPFSMDSPLDVITPEPTNSSISLTTGINDSLIPKLESRDNGFDDEHHKRNKSKKKKEKHRHKEKHMKKKKSHKSDREDRKDPSLKLILKSNSDSKSSPESLHTPVGSLKIKLPIKDINKTDLNLSMPPMPTAPLKLKISKEKIGGGFNNSVQNMNDGGSTSSTTSHKKKDKDRSKSKSSKHGNNNNNSDFKDVGFQQQQHQQLSVNKMHPQVAMHQYQNAPNAYDMTSFHGMNNFQQAGFSQQPHQQMPHQQQPFQPQHQQLQQQQQQQLLMNNQLHHQQQQQQQFPDYFQNPNMNMGYSGYNSNGGSINKK